MTEQLGYSRKPPDVKQNQRTCSDSNKKFAQWNKMETCKDAPKHLENSLQQSLEERQKKSPACSTSMAESGNPARNTIRTNCDRCSPHGA